MLSIWRIFVSFLVLYFVVEVTVRITYKHGSASLKEEELERPLNNRDGQRPLNNRDGRDGVYASNNKLQQDQQNDPLNVVVLYPDDWRHSSLGGVDPVVVTPFLNSLAREGIRFTHNCVTTSICWISRATLFTGQYASRHQSLRLTTPKFYRTWQSSWPAILQTAGYYVAHVGKWQFANPDHKVEGLFNWTSLFEGRHWHQLDGKIIHATDLAQNEAIRFLRERPKDSPFAVTVAFFPPKARDGTNESDVQWSPKPSSMSLYEKETIPEPINADAAWEKLPYFFHLENENFGRMRWKERFAGGKYQTGMKNYYRLITEVDAACKAIVHELMNQGILEETLIVFTTDNGYFHGEHGLAGKCYPYQESIRVPLITRDPRMPLRRRGTLDESLTLNIDLAATILGAARIKPHHRMQGQDIADLYLSSTGQKSWRTEFFYEFMFDKWVALPTCTALVRKNVKYIHWPQYGYEQLFDLLDDPLEQTDVANASSYAEQLKEIRSRHNMLEQLAV